VLRSHLLLLVIFALCVSTVFAALMRDDVREQVSLGLRMFGGLLATALVLGWLMYPFPI
jgi:F0F1-type ATP synthase membrane subunit a